jgi:heparan-sulfate lyase
MRSGYDEDAHWGFFDIGPWGTGHQHNDKLHLSVTAYGRDLLVDAGRFAYRGDLARKFRRYATGSAGHNVILIDSAGQAAGPQATSEPVSENQYKITEQFDFASSSFEAFSGIEGESKHSRSVFYMRGKFWIVLDQVDTDRPRHIQALWHWHPDIDVATRANGVVSTTEDKGNLNVIPVGNTAWKIQHVKGQEEPSPQGWYSEKYNVSEPAVATIYSAQIQNSASFIWILQPSEKSVTPLSAEIVSQDRDKVTLRIRDERSNQWEVIVPFTNSSLAAYSFRPASSKHLESDLSPSLANEVNTLLARLDLNKRELAAVRRSKNDPAKAAQALLAYFRSRKSVTHPVDRKEKLSMRGKAATDKDLEEADNALRHVFIGQGAYPPYYCGDDIDWSSRPVPDNEWVWQLNRMGFWEAMAKAYWHTGDERYAREWALQLLDWTQKNPRDEAHAYAWRSIEAGIRGHRWTGLFQRFIDSPSFSPAVLVAFLNSCYDHASYLMTKYRKGSNWGLMEAEGMAFIAMTFPEFAEAITWRTEAITRLNSEIENQVYADGHQRELAMGYHTGSIGWFKRTLDMARLNGVEGAFPKTYLSTIEKMCEIPFKLGLPDGSSTQFGDSWTGEPGRLWPALKEWGQVFNRDDFLYVATEGKQGRQPDATAFALESSGFYSMRSGWEKDAVCLVLKCGPDGGGHCQPDNGTFELYAGGRHLMPDAGSYIYSGDPEGRAWFRQTKVHQTLTLNEENSAYAPKLRLWKPGPDLDVLVVENASYPELTHRRAVFFVDKKYFIIVDDAIGSATGDVDIHFQFAPGQAVFDSTNFSVRSDFTEGWNVMVQSHAQKQLQLTEEEGWVSFVYTKKEKRPAFRYRIPKSSTAGVRFVTVVIPYEGIIPPPVQVRLSEDAQPGDTKLALTVVANGVTKEISCEIPNTGH